jgi:hypothetical protein
MASASRPVHAAQGGPLQRGDDSWKRSGAGSERARAALEPSPGRLDPACCAQAFQFRRPDDPFGTAHTGNAPSAAAFLSAYLPSGFRTSLLLTQAKTGKNTQELIAAALNELFRAYGVPVVGAGD